MADIKSAREIAMERLAKLEDATDEERLKWKFTPQGEELAASYLNQDCNLVAELSKYQENERRYVVEGAGGILARHINLPTNDLAKKNNRKAMEGFKLLVKDKASVENVYTKMRQIFNHYLEQGEQQRNQAYESLKAQFEAKVQQALQQQMGPTMTMKVDVTRQPQFQEEWRKVQHQLDSQYLQHLNEYKRELLSIN